MLDGFRPGKLAALGVGPAQMTAENPRLIHVSITGYGLTGPYRDRTGHDLSYQAMAGLLADQAQAGSPGPVPSLPWADACAGLFTVLAVLAALAGRHASGVGTQVDVSMTDALVSVMTIFLSPLMNGAPIGELINEPAYGTFACADGRLITVSIAHEDWFWAPFCDAIGIPELGHLKGRERVNRSAELRQIVAERLRTKPSGEWQSILDAKSLPWGPVNRLDDVVRDPHFQARQLFQAITRADGALEHHVFQPLKFLGVVNKITRASPKLGEHTDEVLRELGRIGTSDQPRAAGG